MATSRLHVDPHYIERADEPGFADAFARIGEFSSKTLAYFLFSLSIFPLQSPITSSTRDSLKMENSS